ncbi:MULTISPECIES: division/cell wall cluster transcriptional repressor MraZ [Acetomicrobium]|uniref:Transcriptional regulator MraZ n=1 Tax=Acetomicrobium hydrogeniformans TaxID=649746 RepID=A0A7V6ZFS1_9BACT|nr:MULTISPECIES: division/cell wall cluster transcriptional repressor MraZ [Acetomicrobium]HHZ04946.1 division/cell wall cluster transcriptional repressor MraZ [Acetomicrobium hydrogeniformans]
MMIGTYEHRLDSKGRLVLPSKFRQEMGEQLVASVGVERCISLYSKDEWEKLLEKLQKMPFSQSKARDFLRVFLATAHEITLDSAGRILLPQMLKSHAYLETEVSIIGVGDHLEIWDRETWNKYRQDILSNLSTIVEGVEWKQ